MPIRRCRSFSDADVREQPRVCSSGSRKRGEEEQKERGEDERRYMSPSTTWAPISTALTSGSLAANSTSPSVLHDSTSARTWRQTSSNSFHGSTSPLSPLTADDFHSFAEKSDSSHPDEEIDRTVQRQENKSHPPMRSHDGFLAPLKRTQSDSSASSGHKQAGKEGLSGGSKSDEDCVRHASQRKTEMSNILSLCTPEDGPKAQRRIHSPTLRKGSSVDLNEPAYYPTGPSYCYVHFSRPHSAKMMIWEENDGQVRTPSISRRKLGDYAYHARGRGGGGGGGGRGVGAGYASDDMLSRSVSGGFSGLGAARMDSSNFQFGSNDMNWSVDSQKVRNNLYLS